MFATYKKMREKEGELLRLKELLKLKDKALDEAYEKLENEKKENANLNRFRIKMLETLGLIGADNNNERALKEVKRLKQSNL